MRQRSSARNYSHMNKWKTRWRRCVVTEETEEREIINKNRDNLWKPKCVILKSCAYWENVALKWPSEKLSCCPLNPVSQNRLLHTLAHKLSYARSPHVVTAKVVLKPGREREAKSNLKWGCYSNGSASALILIKQFCTALSPFDQNNLANKQHTGM